MSGTRGGRCLCGAVRFTFEGPLLWSGHCHCESCRRQCSSGFTSFFGVPDDRWRWTGAMPAVYRSSPTVRRSFCGTCGSPMAYQSDGLPGQIEFYAASLDDPAGFAPDGHVHTGERLPWVALADDLPKLEGGSA